MPPKSKKQQFILICWLEDEMVGVMPLTSVAKDEKLFVGAVVQMKWKTKYYETEVLKLAGA